MSNGCPIYGRAREWTPLDAPLACPALRLSWSVHHRSQTRWHLVDLALAFRSGVRALAMSESHVRKVINSAASCGPSDYDLGVQFESLRGRSYWLVFGAQSSPEAPVRSIFQDLRTRFFQMRQRDIRCAFRLEIGSISRCFCVGPALAPKVSEARQERAGDTTLKSPRSEPKTSAFLLCARPPCDFPSFPVSNRSSRIEPVQFNLMTGNTIAS